MAWLIIKKSFQNLIKFNHKLSFGEGLQLDLNVIISKLGHFCIEPVFDNLRIFVFEKMSEEFYLGAIAEAWGITKDQGTCT